MIHSRLYALIVSTLLELVDAVHASHSSGIAKDDFIRANPNHRSISIEEILYCSALSHADDMGSDPKI